MENPCGILWPRCGRSNPFALNPTPNLDPWGKSPNSKVTTPLLPHPQSQRDQKAPKPRDEEKLGISQELGMFTWTGEKLPCFSTGEKGIGKPHQDKLLIPKVPPFPPLFSLFFFSFGFLKFLGITWRNLPHSCSNSPFSEGKVPKFLKKNWDLGGFGILGNVVAVLNRAGIF